MNYTAAIIIPVGHDRIRGPCRTHVRQLPKAPRTPRTARDHQGDGPAHRGRRERAIPARDGALLGLSYVNLQADRWPAVGSYLRCWPRAAQPMRKAPR